MSGFSTKRISNLLFYVYVLVTVSCCATTNNVNTGLDEGSLRCSSAFYELPVEIQKGGLDQIKFLRYAKLYSDAFLKYESACLISATKENLADGVYDKLKHSIGAIFISDTDRELVCAATRVTNEYVITARHCLIKRIIDRSNSSTVEYQKPESVTFSSIDKPQNEIQALSFRFIDKGLSTSDEALSDLNDIVLIQLDDKKNSGSHYVSVGPDIPEGEYILLVAPSLISLKYEQKENQNYWPNSMKFSRLQGGQRIQSKNIDIDNLSNSSKDKCIYHGLPTYFGMSGAGLFVFLSSDVDSEFTPYLGGIHIRDGVNTSDTQRECGTSEYNVCLLYTSPSPRDRG